MIFFACSKVRFLSAGGEYRFLLIPGNVPYPSRPFVTFWHTPQRAKQLDDSCYEIRKPRQASRVRCPEHRDIVVSSPAGIPWRGLRLRFGNWPIGLGTA